MSFIIFLQLRDKNELNWSKLEETNKSRDQNTWNSSPARGPWKFKASKSFDETVTTSAAFAHLDERRENDMPLIQSSDGFVLVRTTCKKFIILIHFGSQSSISKIARCLPCTRVHEYDWFSWYLALRNMHNKSFERIIK